MKRIISIAAYLSLLMFASAVFAQDTPKTINGGVLNGKAMKLPKPVYPAEARERKAEGTVAIKVTIDEEGNVIEAIPQPLKSTRKADDDDSTEVVKEEMPDPSLAEAARAAAMEAQFSPTKLSGVPVKVTGVITYNFALGETKDLKSISGGVLNGKAVTLPAPEYPASAKAVKASGTVSVQVLIDEGGNVIAATAVSGHPLLRAAAVEAARAANFSPTLLNGSAVKVSGVLTYNFALPDDGQN